MAGGGFVSSAGIKQYAGRMTGFVIITCIMAASGGLIFGYDIGISGGVTSMDDFLSRFFPAVYDKEIVGEEDGNEYCKFDSQILTTFTSSLYVAGLLASFVASTITRLHGRKPSMLLGGTSFLIGAAINGAAMNVAMLIIGRILLGVGVGFANQSVPVYLSEMAPAKYRGALNIMFQLAITIGILAANLINYGTGKVTPWGWRLSLGLAAIPAAIMTLGSALLPDTPNSMIERGEHENGRTMLRKIRGVDDVDAEYDDIVQASEAARQVEHPWRNILQRRYRPHLVMAIMIPLFQQLTGINSIMFYAPVLFKTLGFTSDASLYSSVITGIVNVLATIVSLVLVDRIGRRTLFLEAGVQMFISQVVIGGILGAKFGLMGTGSIDKMSAVIVVVVVCVYVSAFGWSWGPLGWLVPSEIFPLEIRSAGQAINVSVNLFFTFVIAQAFLAMLCHFKFGIFLFFAGWVVIMSLFVYFFLPETKNVPIEEMDCVWRAHPCWGRFIPSPDQERKDLELSM
ncbi:hypothetical protein GOP47_0000654 [Adiantum capillus-veneris]|uniref:Major facilitator superfamily (MFS) profile domain-containing protein n=1 Tax=Adiantum capillus-veneris TaxID=13818 RepID=A0A9D4VEC5_ADICA|nr:hypothetical protein GOP47_0000654 [Adiantum capillus-veneris]